MSQSRAKLHLITAMFIYGTIGLFVKWIDLPSSLIANVRGLVGTVFLLLVVAVRKDRLHWDAIRANLRWLIPTGIMLGFNWIFLFEAYRYVSVAVATVCYYLAPVFIILVSPFVLKEKLTPVRCLCAAVALVGMVLTSGVIQSGFSGSFRGILLGISAAAMYAAIVMGNKKLKDLPAYDTTIMQLGISAIVLLPYNAFTVDFSALTLPPKSVLLLLVVGVVHTGFAYCLYFGCLPHLKAQTAAIFSYIDPIVAILLSALILREPLDALSAIGAVLVLGSTLVSELWEGRKKAA